MADDDTQSLPAELPAEVFAPQQPITPGYASKAYDILTGGNGQERYQLFPERIVRSALSLPTDVMSGKVQTAVSGGNQPLSSDTGPEDELLQRVQDMAALMGGGGIGMAPKAALGTAGAKLIQPAAEEAIAPIFHSAVENAVNTSTLKSANPDQWLGTIKNAKGVKPEELDWTGLKDWLGEQEGPISKEQVQGYLEQNKVGLGEVNRQNLSINDLQAKYEQLYPKSDPYDGGTSLSDWKAQRDTWVDERLKEEKETKYSKYQLPGGESYREKLLTLPTDTGALKVVKNENGMFNIVDKNGNVQKLGSAFGTFGSEATALQVLKSETGIGKEIYKSSHWDEPNILAHIRMNDRTVEGKNALHIEEIQSDWHQQGREHGYKTTPEQKAELETIDQKLMNGLEEKDIGNPDMDAVLKTAIDKKVITPAEAANYKQYSKGENSTIPDAPFKKTWLDLALKRVIREAAEGGKDRISWTPGEAQAARYDLSKQVDSIGVKPEGENKHVTVMAKSGVHASGLVNKEGKIVQGYDAFRDAVGKPLADVIGKEMAKKLMELEGEHTIAGEGLKVGGEGMHYFYDKMLPAALEKLTGQKMKVGNILKEKGLPESTGNTAMKWPATPDKMQPINYIDLPQSVKNTALHKGFPLFSSGLMLSPLEEKENPFARSKYKLVPVSKPPVFK